MAMKFAPYSVLNTFIGLISVARLAGIALADSVTIKRRADAAHKVKGSRSEMPYKRLDKL
jgi:hypothetical protein